MLWPAQHVRLVCDCDLNQDASNRLMQTDWAVDKNGVSCRDRLSLVTHFTTAKTEQSQHYCKYIRHQMTIDLNLHAFHLRICRQAHSDIVE